MPNQAKKLKNLAKAITQCQACRLSLTRRQSLPGKGNPNARLLVIAQAPGEEEDKSGKLFIGPSGKIYHKLLVQAGIDPLEVFQTNLIKCYLPKCRRPKMDEITTCFTFLEKEIEIVNPDIIVPLGYYSTRTMFEYYGFPQISRQEYIQYFGKLIIRKDQKIFPLQHPASILHKPELKPVLEKNYLKLRILKSPCKWHDVCPIDRHTKEGKIKTFWQSYYCEGDWESCTRYQLEEKHIPHPDNMLPNGSIFPDEE